jgi:hypothetical protein
MLGTVLSGNLIQLVVFWELTGLTSFMLIAYWYHRPDARRGARMAAIVTVGGGLALLLGVLGLGEIAGSYDLDAVLAAGDVIRNHSWYPALLWSDPARRFHEERAVPVPLLAAARDGRADAGIRVLALGDDGQSGRVPARTALARARRDRPVDPARVRRRRRVAARRHVCGDLSARHERACSRTRRSGISASSRCCSA